MSHFEPGDGRVHVRQRDEAPKKRGLSGLLVMAAGVAAFGAIIMYAYSQGNRAGTESVAPVLHADQGPSKVKPEQPGGMEVPHQDKLVYDRLNPGAAGDPGVERLLPPPEEPLARPRAAEPPPEETAAAADPDLPPEAGPPAAAAPAPQPAAPVPPVAQTPPPAVAQPAPPPVAKAAPAPAPSAAPPPVAPPAPAPKPAPQVAAAPPPAAAAAPAGGGTVRIQLASVGDEARAASEWQRLSRKHAGVLGGVGYRVVKADLGAKGIYYRVQAGPVDEARAKTICDALKAKGDGCIPVR